MIAPTLTAARLTLRVLRHLRRRARLTLIGLTLMGLPLVRLTLTAAMMAAAIATLMLAVLVLATMIPVLRHRRRHCGTRQQHCGDHQSHPTHLFSGRRLARHLACLMHPYG